MARRRPSEQSANPARGVILVVVAVLLGLFLLRHGLNTSVTLSGSQRTTTDGGTAGATTSGSTTSTSAALRSPAQVPTVVLNGSSTNGAAKKYSDALAAAGYDLTNPNGATATTKVTATEVLYNPGFQREAGAVATAIGAPQTSVQPIGTTQPGTTNNAQVIVVLGPDLAAKTPPSSGSTSTSGAR